MLREDVVEAVRAGRFKIYSIGVLDDAVELLMGVAAGAKRADGSYPGDSINGRVLARLRRFAAELKAYSAHHDYPEGARPAS
jgi:hypothetical protein